MLFSDNFEAEVITDPDGWEMNYASFANFFVGGGGTVDLLGTPNGFGLVGDGQFVDLDGSSGQAGFLETIQQFDVAAGQLVTLSFSGGGSQRGQGIDNLFGGFRFFGTPVVSGVTLRGFATAETSNAPSPTLFGVDPFVFATDPYQTYSISFRTNAATRFSAVIGTGGGDNIGPLVDNVTISAQAIPEPATWGLMILGFGTAGAMLRRRRSGALAAA